MSALDRRLITHINWSLMGFTAILFCVGVANLYSASGVRNEDGIFVSPFFHKQLLWGLGGVASMTVCTLFDYRHLRSLALPLFIFSLLLLLLVPVIGKSVYGAKRWIDLGFFSLQPSEFAKISTLLLSASLLSRHKEPLNWRELFFMLCVVPPPCLLIFFQPDLGTTLMVLFLFGGTILYNGVKKHVFKTCCIVIPLLLPFSWLILKDYHKERIFTFLDPSRDLQGAGYHITQSQIAIGSGQLWGKGFQEGTQSLLRFLPEKHTDFAFAVFSEEWGFLGCIALLVLFCFFLSCIINTVRGAKDRFGSILCAGVFFYFFWQILVNIGMVVGLMPVVGIPLPFISYGGTATIVNFIMLGLVLNVSMRRFMFKSN
ncbi:MAG: rod shape-determining protein RodA [Desulfovibrio sp.]|jgi:rod shape determining protein RodA|nr:rod shape-determining protein RodA [Desulfovibrio sp.]